MSDSASTPEQEEDVFAQKECMSMRDVITYALAKAVEEEGEESTEKRRLLHKRDGRLSSTVIHAALGRQICRFLEDMSVATIDTAAHDKAVLLLDEIYCVLDDERIDDDDCIERILAIYYREFARLTLRHKNRLRRIVQLSKEM